jgi:glucan 1,3-beta-glucosidase
LFSNRMSLHSPHSPTIIDIISFITPSLFERFQSPDNRVIDEWSLCEYLGKQGCSDALKPHWEWFVQLADFQKIRDGGLNVIRIPIGYWAFLDIGAPYVNGQVPYLDRAIDWARQTGLKVIIDLHGAPKSQNGFDHSGHKHNGPEWGQGDSISQTLQTLRIIYAKYAVPAYQDVVIAIQLLNEPLMSSLGSDMVKQFYRDAFFTLRETSDTPAMVHDGFQNPALLNNFLTPSDHNAYGLIVDHHEYQIFDSGLVAMGLQQHLQLVCGGPAGYATSDKWTIVGEWSGAFTDCAKYLNGYGNGNRMEGTWPGSWYIGSCAGKSGRVSTWTQAWKDDVRQYIEAQLDAYEAKTQGWVFWNFKTEGDAGEWDLFQLLDGGVFPQPLDSRKFARACNNF